MLSSPLLIRLSPFRQTGECAVEINGILDATELGLEDSSLSYQQNQLCSPPAVYSKTVGYYVNEDLSM